MRKRILVVFSVCLVLSIGILSQWEYFLHTIYKNPIPDFRNQIWRTKSTEELLEERNDHLRKACQALGWNMTSGNISVQSWRELRGTEKPRLYFSDKYKLLVCGVPKCASTEMRKALLIMEGIVNVTSPNEIEHEQAFELAMKHRNIWRRFNWQTKEGAKEIEKRLNSYYRLMVVREPLERLVSAYIDKMLPNGSGTKIYLDVSRRIHKQYNKDKNRTDGLASFSEFITNIQDTQRKFNLDIHWRPYSTICDPCAVKYHHIAKLETITRDSKYVSDKLGIDNNLLFPGEITDINKQHKWKAKYAEYFRKLPMSQTLAMYQYHKAEYMLFGYQPPPFIEPTLLQEHQE